ncbi:MAG: Fur family transcriptional regulator [Ilumatobacteraceae bacterium]
MPELDAVVRPLMDGKDHRYTQGRRALVDTLARLAAPVTIPTLLREMPDAVQSSLYRNLAVLEDAGVVTRVDVGEGRSYFELSEQVTQEHHHHLVCRECRTVVDIALPSRAERSIERVLEDAAHYAGFDLTEHRIDLVGICANCHAA